MTRLGRYITGRSPKAGFDGVSLVPAGTFSDPTFIPRLSWSGLAAKVAFDWDELCESIAEAPADISFVCDTSLFDDATDPRLWPALLNQAGKLILTPRVLVEMKPWFSTHPDHPVKVAMDAEDESVAIVDYTAWTEAERNSFLHYVNLLGMRKGAMRLSEMRFEQEVGRPPTASDADAVRADVQSHLGERGYMFAKKGAGRGRRPTTHWTDEEVVYTALAHALRSGAETFVLTKDEDLMDQMYRLVYLVDTHYRSMLIADAYRKDFASFRTHAMPTGGPYDEAFVGRNDVLVERDDDFPQQVLRENFSFVAVHCLLLGRRLSTMTFGAEREMHEVLEIKGSRDGRNSAVLLPRNVHLALPGFTWPERYGNCFALAEDRCLTLPTSGWQIPYVDSLQAVLTTERFKHYQERHPLQ